MAEQYRLDELRHRERDICDRERACEPRLGREKIENTEISAQKQHDRLRPEPCHGDACPGTPKAASDLRQDARYAKTLHGTRETSAQLAQACPDNFGAGAREEPFRLRVRAFPNRRSSRKHRPPRRGQYYPTAAPVRGI